MSIVPGQRVKIGAAKGDRERYQGRSGELLRLQKSRILVQRGTYAHVLLDGSERSRVFWTHELLVEAEEGWLGCSDSESDDPGGWAR